MVFAFPKHVDFSSLENRKGRAASLLTHHRVTSHPNPAARGLVDSDYLGRRRRNSGQPCKLKRTVGFQRTHPGYMIIAHY